MQKGGVLAAQGRAGEGIARGQQLLHTHHMLEVFDLRLQEPRERSRFRHRDEDACPGVGEDAYVASQVVFDLRQTHWRIDRHRYTAGDEDGKEA